MTQESVKKFLMTLIAPLLIVILGIVAWYPVLNFWFLKAFEASWLHDALPYTLTQLIRTHAFLYWLDFKLFGWEPAGWYGTALFLHIIAALLLYRFVLILTQNRVAATITGLIFVASTAYNDVLTWGSFNSYYPLLLSWILLGFTAFVQYKQTKKTKYWLLSMIFLVLAFYTRETGIIAVPLLSLFDLMTAGDLRKRATWLELIKRQFPYYALLVVFFLLRNMYGGTIGDTVDSNVKYQIRMVHDHLYVEYARAIALTFGKIIPPIFIPYLWLNEWRAAKILTGDGAWLQTYFFPIIGWVTYGGFALLLVLFRKQKQLFTTMLYFWLWVGLFSLFIALATPDVPEVLTRPYQIITMRYRYFAFAGASISFALVLTTLYSWLGGWLAKKKRIHTEIKFWLPKAALVAVLLGIVGLNYSLLQYIHTEAYATLYRAGKEFQTKFREQFPTLPTNVAFYIYPHASGLNDSLFEWYLTKETHYPNLVGQPYRIESQVEAAIDKVKQGKLALSDFVFLDYDAGTGMVNKTEAVRTAIENQRTIGLNFVGAGDRVVTATGFDGPAVELPQNLVVSTSTRYRAITPTAQSDRKKFRALVDYAVDRKHYLDTVKLTTCRTISQRDEEPFYYYHPEHLVDGNTGRRSAWIADAVPAWIQADLTKEQEVKAVAWGSIEGSTRVPASYTIQSSNNGTEWQTIKTVKNNAKFTGLDTFDQPIKARYIKMMIETTNTGDFVQMDEFEVITKKGEAALALYNDRTTLINESRNPFTYATNGEDLAYAQAVGLNFGWGKASWGVDKASNFADTQFVYFPYAIGQSSPATLKLPEAEIYAGPGEMLTKHFNSISIDLSNAPVEVTAIAGQLVPRYK